VTEEKRKLEPPMKLDIAFGEALSRFVATIPKEIDASIERSKTGKPPGEGTSRRPARQRRETLEPDRKRKPGTN
jgi:hypothetical protein